MLKPNTARAQLLKDITAPLVLCVSVSAPGKCAMSMISFFIEDKISNHGEFNWTVFLRRRTT